VVATRDSLHLTAVERVAAVLIGFVVVVVLRETAFDDANGDMSLIGNAASLAIGLASTAPIVTTVWALRCPR
jgi:hypothetical protein